MNLLQAIVLALVQGITEWLPISSSAHLALISKFFKISEGAVFYTILLHFTTALVVLFMFRKDFLEMAKAFFTFDFKSSAGKKALFLIIATIPAAFAGVFLKPFFELVFYSITAISALLFFNGVFLFFVEKWPGKRNLDYKNTFVMGLAQIAAIMPGISRSGITIGTGLLLKIKKQEAAKFAFFMAVPLLIGAGIYELIFSPVILNTSIFTIIFGVFVTAVTTAFAIKLLLKLITSKKLWYFGIYCIVLSAVLFLATFL